MTFYLKCPECDWRTFDKDDSYRRSPYCLDCYRDYERHYRMEHAPIPLAEVVDV